MDVDSHERSMNEQKQINMSFQHKVESLELHKESVQKKHQREIESLNLEIQDKKL